MKEDWKHLKWKLINQDGLTPDEADERIRQSNEWIKKEKERKEKKNGN